MQVQQAKLLKIDQEIAIKKARLNQLGAGKWGTYLDAIVNRHMSASDLVARANLTGELMQLAFDLERLGKERTQVILGGQ